MFYCEDCKENNQWPESLSRSHGRCEVCGMVRLCYDRPSSSLPEKKRSGVGSKSALPVPMFPEDECTRVTDHVFIHKPKYPGCGYRVWFQVGVQRFRVGVGEFDTLEEARWYAEEFVKALERYRAGGTTSVRDDQA